MPGTERPPEDPSAAYATAVENTRTSDHHLVYRDEDDDVVTRFARDVSDRQTRTWPPSDVGERGRYTESGTLARWHPFGAQTAGYESDPLTIATRDVEKGYVAAYPGYWRESATDRRLTGDRALPRPGTGEWEVIEERDGTLTLGLSDADAVAALIDPAGPAPTDVNEAWVRVYVDTERGVVTGGSARINTSTEASRGHWTGLEESYAVRTGDEVDVERPDRLGPRSPGEWLWKVFAY